MRGHLPQQKVGGRVPLRDLMIPGAVLFLFIIIGLAIAQFGGPLKSSHVPQPKSAERMPGPIIELEPFTVSMTDAQTTNFMRVKLLLELDQAKTVAALKRNPAQVQFLTGTILADQTHDSIRSLQGKELLRARLQQAINNALPEVGVKAVYFRELLYD